MQNLIADMTLLKAVSKEMMGAWMVSQLSD